MFGLEILEVAIGIIFIYLLVAIVCSSIREGIESWLKSRAACLEFGIRELLHDFDGTGLARDLYNHPLIYSLYAAGYTPAPHRDRDKLLLKGHQLPSYIPARNFALALMDIAARGPKTDVYTSHPAAPALTFESVRANVLNIGNAAVQRAVLTALDSAQGDFNRAVQNVQAWYDSSMDRVSGWYKRKTQWILFWIGLFIAVALNVNTITIADHLYRDDAARAALVARAEAAAADSTLRNQGNYEQARLALDSLRLPIGWKEGLGTTRQPVTTLAAGFWFYFASPALGWLLTAFAAVMGAPFWFDLLNKVMVIRSTVKPHEKSPEEGSEDRQPKTRNVVAAPAPAAGGAGEPAAPAVPTTPQFASLPGPGLSSRDLESEVDGCDVDMVTETSDEELPAARGGVA